MTLKRLVKSLFRNVGLDVRRASMSPTETLLGVQSLPTRTVIDVGANRGQFAQLISAKFPEANLWCFEPLEEPLRELRSWAQKYGKGRISLFDFALGDAEGTLKMWHHLDHSPSSSVLKTTRVTEELYPFTKRQVPTQVTVRTLDKVVRDSAAPLHSDILIKLDVQGYEDRVIKGGIETFSDARACILEVCLDALYDGQASGAKSLK